MEKELSSCDFHLHSHPDKILFRHLSNVGNKSILTSREKILSLEKFGIDENTFSKIAFLIGICHDFGKGTKYFQRYLFETDPAIQRGLKNKKEYHHGLISAIFTYYILEKYVNSLNNDNSLRLIPTIGYLIVKRHHGNLKNAEDEIRELVNEDTLEVIDLQIKSLEISELKTVYEQLLDGYDISFDIDTFCNEYRSIAGEILKNRRKFVKLLKEEQFTGYYLITLTLYSILINSDKIDASSIDVFSEIDISSELVDKYKVEKGFQSNENTINKVRNEIYKEVTESIEKLDLDNKIYSISVPTGSGKTLTSLSFALKLKARLREEKRIKAKIIYSLPFLSIIDQNYDVFEDVFKTVERANPTEDVLLKHHHLADIFYKTQEDEEFEGLKSLFLIEGWNSEIIVTTFVQFFHTIVSNKNRSLRKFHTIANSIVILDEVQSIPHKYWLLLKQLISGFGEYFNTYFIFVTATQPLIFDPEKKEILELVNNKDKYFREFDRVKLEINLNPMNLNDFKEIIESKVKENPEKDFLFVLNTIKSSLDIFKHLNDLELENSSYYYLSTNIVPKVRLNKIKEIKEKSEKRKIIVSTQLIEAGVDIDVDIVYRDFATIDSINQVSGRCNRNSSKSYRGEVNIVVLKDERKEFHRYIYSSFLIDKTKEVLKESPSEIYEADLLLLNNNYFRKVKDTSSEDESKELLSCINELKFKTLTSDFRLIDDKAGYEKIDVFVELDVEAVEIWKEYILIKSLKNPLERKERFLAIRKKFSEYIISIPKKDFSCEEPEDLNIGYIPFEQIKHYYDPDTGFVFELKSSMMCD
ncbi:MAG: CRISPR-associated helicase Cas3' [Methanosarcina sp.]|uniref:CRISPR-associated helicase Cas3' n=1 Tax=Methanosarcina sp. TaxID=2213 RepID=UPI002602DEDA|nr:CRISPR-associated helicase Cas3' [Methanosarcina sp.]MDD3246497.1 CRISPR-associated helicase Cas3' [Methanosarcina sp.]MDD4248230.1 CRISPR-associated helicase Cas3' [Methanosarcina sp.]